MIQNTPLGGSLLGTTLYDRICKNQEPALLSPQVYKNELFGRPYLAIGGDFDTIHSAHALRLKSSAAAPGPNTYQPPKMPAIKGGSFGRAFHKSEIEGMIERAAGAPGPGEYRFEHSDIASSVKPSIRARVASSRRAYNGVGGAFGMQLIAPKKQSLKSSFCVCANNWTCHYCTGQRVNLVSSVGTRCPTAQVRVFKDCLHPQLQNLRAVSPDRSISRTNKYLPFKQNVGLVQFEELDD